MVFNGVGCWLSFSFFSLVTNPAGVEAGKEEIIIPEPAKAAAKGSKQLGALM